MQGAASPYVYTLALDAAGHLVAGGAFTAAAGTAAPGIARWNGSTWSGLGAGLAGGPVRALAVTEMGEVIAGGSFTEAGGVAASRVARWSGGRWHALGKGVDGTVFAVAPAGVAGQVYAGGSFTSPRFFTRWDGVRWQAYGAGLTCAAASCIPAGLGLFSAPGGDLYVGGYFDHAGGIAANGIARWDGASWSPLSGLAPGVYSLVMDSAGNLYVSGDFPTTIGGTTYNYVAKWDGAAWSSLGSGLPYASTLAFDPTGTLHAGGGMTTPHHGWVARWDGATWRPIGAGGWNHMNSVVSDMTIDSAGGLYEGGEFTMAGGQPVRYLAKWDGSTWQQLGDIGHRVFGLHFDPAGNLWAVGDTVIARWDGASWLTVGATQYAWDVVVDRAGHAYAVGQFDAIDETPVSNIGMWDGAAWRPLGSGITPSGWWLYPYQPAGLDLALDGNGNLFVVGWHQTAGGKPSSHISRWTASDSRQVSGPGSYTLYVDNLPVTIHVKQQGTLHYLYAQRHDKSYPCADPSLDTGYFWEIVGADAAGNPAAGYTVDVTLSTAFNPDASDRVCRIQDSTWDCAATLLAEYSVMRTDVTNLSSLWAVQDNHFEHLFPDWLRQHLRTTSRLERFNPLSVSN
jgi:hypothetical protein